ncbi:hypothetical protein D3C71_1161160 [compost metagenome]
MGLNQFLRKTARYLHNVKQFHLMSRLGFRRGMRDLDVFARRYPITAFVVTQYCWAMNHKDNLLSPFWTRWHALKERILSGPKKLTLSTLNRRDYCDPEELLLHASFQILVDFVEIQLPHEDHTLTNKELKYGKRYPDIALKFLNQNKITYGKHAETLALYEYWTKVAIPWLENDSTAASKTLAMKIMKSSDDKSYYKLDSHLTMFHQRFQQEMLTRLIAHRHNLWT